MKLEGISGSVMHFQEDGDFLGPRCADQLLQDSHSKS